MAEIIHQILIHTPNKIINNGYDISLNNNDECNNDEYDNKIIRSLLFVLSYSLIRHLYNDIIITIINNFIWCMY